MERRPALEFNSGLNNCGMEIDGAGNFYLTAWPSDGVWKFSPAGAKPGPARGRRRRSQRRRRRQLRRPRLHPPRKLHQRVRRGGRLRAQIRPARRPLRGPPGCAGDRRRRRHRLRGDERRRAGAGGQLHADRRHHDPRCDHRRRERDAEHRELTGEVDPDVANGGTPIDTCSFECGIRPGQPRKRRALRRVGAVRRPRRSDDRRRADPRHHLLLQAHRDQRRQWGHLERGGQDLQPAGPPEITNEPSPTSTPTARTISATINPGGGLHQIPDRIRADRRLWRRGARNRTGTRRQPDPGRRQLLPLGADAGHHLPLPDRRHRTRTGTTVGPDHELQDILELPRRRRPVSQRAGAPADGRRPAASIAAPTSSPPPPDTDGYDVSSNSSRARSRSGHSRAPTTSSSTRSSYGAVPG